MRSFLVVVVVLAGGCSLRLPAGSFGTDGDADGDADADADAAEADGDGEPSCASDLECDDGAPCNGAERCDPLLGCRPGTPPECDDGDPCTRDECVDELGGCVSTFIDEDGDGDSPLSCGGTDCDDTDATVNAGARELPCSGRDEDCDSATPDGPDQDGDGYDVCGALDPANPDGLPSDCDDESSSVSPGAAEACDGRDNDCDGVIDQGYLDSDGDGVANCVDPVVWSDDFEDGDASSWTFVALNRWDWEWVEAGGVLTETSADGRSLGHGSDLGELESYAVSVDISPGGRNDTVGIVFAFRDSSDYWQAGWWDPTDDYSTYWAPSGQVTLRHCVDESCATLAEDLRRDLSVGADEWASLSVCVSAAGIRVRLQGLEVLFYDGEDTSALGPWHVGLLSMDSDSGVRFDDFSVTTPCE